MPATRSSTTDRRTCLGACGESLPLDAEHFASAGRKLSGAPKYRSRCRRCMKAQQDTYRETLRELGQAVNAAPAERKHYLPCAPLGDRMRRAVEREARNRGETQSERWAVLEARGGPCERTVFAWQFERKRVEVTTAAEALDLLGLLLVDAYPQQLLDEVLPPVELDD